MVSLFFAMPEGICVFTVSNQGMTDQVKKDKSLTPALVEQLREVRSLLLEQYHAHQTGVALPPEHPLSQLQRMGEDGSSSAHLPPKHSLALRSQISYITEIIEPGTKEMWPDYTHEEEAYMADKRLRDANAIGFAALGPFATYAIAADKLGFPPQVVANFIELGFNATAMLSLGRHGRSHSFVGEVVPPEPVTNANRHVRLASSQPLDAINRPPFVAQFTNQPIQKSVPEITEVLLDSQAKNNGHYDASASVTHIKEFLNWRVTARKHYDEALKDGKEAEPILEWLIDPQIEKLGLALHRYGDGRGQILADMRALNKGSDHSIEGLIEHYRTYPLGRSEAYKQVFEFERRLLSDIAGVNAELDPTKLRLVVAKLNAGQYMTSSDYASLEYVRDSAHQAFVENKLETYSSMNKYMKLPDEVLQKSLQELRIHAEATSPYVIKNAPHESELPHDHAPER